jgi:hypothetical protein
MANVQVEATSFVGSFSPCAAKKNPQKRKDHAAAG